MSLIITSNPVFSVPADAVISVKKLGVPSRMEEKLFRHGGEGLRAAYKASGIRPNGRPVITPGHDLRAIWVVHVLTTGKKRLFQKPGSEYRKALQLARKKGWESVALSFSDAESFYLAYSICREFLRKQDMQITLCITKAVFGGWNGPLREQIRQYLRCGDADCTPSIRPGPVCYDSALEEAVPDWTAEEDDLTLALEEDNGGVDDDFSCEYLRRIPAPQATREPAQSTRRETSTSLERAKPLHASAGREFQTLEQYLKQNDAGFRDTLLKYIDRTGKKDSVIYKKANVDRRLYSKILNHKDYNPSKPTAIAFAIALELDLEETRDLIGRAGYALSHASTFDRIIEFFILERNYNIYEINEALFYFDQNLLGC